MRLQFNGAPRNFETLPNSDAPLTIAGLLHQLELPASRVAVELNGNLVKRTEHVAQHLREGDRVEIVTLAGGG